MEPLVSIIVVSYNNLKFIPQCLDSVLGQTYKNTEIIFGNSKSKIDAVNRDLENYHDWDIVLLASDDMIPQVKGYDRIIVLTDGEWHVMDGGTGKAQDVSPAPLTDKAYMINVANTQYGVGYGKWTSIDGWSESVIDYIREFEMLTD